jgi:hypothetical protein
MMAKLHNPHGRRAAGLAAARGRSMVDAGRPGASAQDSGDVAAAFVPLL